MWWWNVQQKCKIRNHFLFCAKSSQSLIKTRLLEASFEAFFYKKRKYFLPALDFAQNDLYIARVNKRQSKHYQRQTNAQHNSQYRSQRSNARHDANVHDDVLLYVCAA
jgi:hypothetical protein